MKAVECDHFKHYKYPGKIEVSESGVLAYTVATVDIEENEYPARLFVRLSGSAEAFDVMDASHLTGFFWAGEMLFINALSGEQDKENADKGLPASMISVYDYTTTTLKELFKLNKNVEYAACLSDDKWLFVCEDNLVTEKLAEKAGGDTDLLLKLIEEESVYITAEEYPLRLDSEGYVSDVRRRAYIYESGALKRITSENMNIALMKTYKDKYAVFYGNEQTGFLKNETSLLYRIDLKTLTVSLIDKERYVYQDLLALNADEIIACRHDRKLFGDSQDFFIDRIALHDASYERLNADCAFHLFSNVYTDVMYDTAESALAADGRNALFICTERDRTNIYRGDFEKKEITNVTGSDRVIMDFRAAGENIYIIAAPSLGGPEIWRIDKTGDALTRITDFNGWIYDEYKLSMPSAFTFTVSDGSHDITGYVMKPIYFEDDKKYPTILHIHGGPNCAFGPNYYHEAQLMASRGYGVIYCNPRGSVGYGGEFADLRGKYYTIDYDGIMEFLDEAIARCTWIDESRLAVTGCSYGGMMTNWAITHTDRFKAAVSDCCCVNEIADYFLSDIGFSFGEDIHGVTLWDEGGASGMWDKSPIKYAPNVTTPTLFIHGADDYRCSAEQSLQMLAALKYHGVPARAVIFKDEKHALAFEGKPASRIRRFEEILAWFDKYLGMKHLGGRRHAED